MDIRFERVTVTHGSTPVLRDVSLSLQEHRIGVIGANGEGKSTLVRLINGLTAPTRGRVTLDGQPVSRATRAAVGFIFSDADNQIIMPTVIEDIELTLHRIPRRERRRRAEEMLESLGIGHLAHRSPYELSGGEKQLVALAAVLVGEPQVILADEPTTLLDLRNRRRLSRVFSRLAQQVIVVTHDLSFLETFDRVICLHDHAVFLDGPPADVLPAYIACMEEES